MARKNRKKRRNGFRFPIPTAGVIAVFGSIALSYLWLLGHCDTLGKEILSLEEELSELEKERDRQVSRWSQMSSTRGILRALADNGMVMVWPGDHQVVEIPAREGARRRELAGRQARLSGHAWQGHIRHE
jgi:hypothetical protein